MERASRVVVAGVIANHEYTPMDTNQFPGFHAFKEQLFQMDSSSFVVVRG